MAQDKNSTNIIQKHTCINKKGCRIWHVSLSIFKSIDIFWNFKKFHEQTTHSLNFYKEFHDKARSLWRALWLYGW